MRIDSIPPKELLSRYSHIREKSTEPVIAQGTDEAQLTEAAKSFSAVLKAAKETIETQTPERAARIEEIAQQIKDGTYSIPGEKVAEKILGR